MVLDLQRPPVTGRCQVVAAVELSRVGEKQALQIVEAKGCTSRTWLQKAGIFGYGPVVCVGRWYLEEVEAEVSLVHVASSGTWNVDGLPAPLLCRWEGGGDKGPTGLCLMWRVI